MSVNDLNISGLSLGTTTIAAPPNQGVLTVWMRIEDGGTELLPYTTLVKISDDVIMLLEDGPGTEDAPAGKYSFVAHVPNNHFGPTQQDWVLKQWINFGAKVERNSNLLSIVSKADKSVIVHWIAGGPPCQFPWIP